MLAGTTRRFKVFLRGEETDRGNDGLYSGNDANEKWDLVTRKW